MFRLWCVLIGYAFGLIQTAFILGKIKGLFGGKKDDEAAAEAQPQGN